MNQLDFMNRFAHVNDFGHLDFCIVLFTFKEVRSLI